MKAGIHPVYTITKVICACGNTFETRSTKDIIKLEICSACHPFFTGQQKLIDSAGRVERFRTRFKKTDGRTVVRKAPKKAVRKLADNRASRRQILTTAPKKEDKSKKKEKKPAGKKA